MRKILPIITATVILAVVLVIFGLGTLDYDLSRALIDRDSVFGNFFNLFGELPANLGAAFAVLILYAGRKREVLWKNILKNAAALPFLLIFIFLAIFTPLNYGYEHTEGGIPQSLMLAAVIVSALVFALAVWYGNSKADREKFRSWNRIAVVMLVLVISEIALVNLIKPIWARPRMRSIESIDQFRYWFQIGGWINDNELKSFPSGHTANGFTMIMFSLFFTAAQKKQRSWFITFAVAWGIMVALSRVILGAHFLTDVAAGGYITLLLFFILKTLFIKEKKEGVTE